MKICPLCKKDKDESEFLGIYCLRCEKIAADVQEDIFRELAGRESVV